MTAPEPLTAQDRQLVLSALGLSRGSYSAERASQLSGVPVRTVYDWASKQVLVPDHEFQRPKSWSYRDLVLLRLIAFLRQHRVDVRDAAELATNFRRQFARGLAGKVETRVSAAQGGYAVGPLMKTDALSGQQAFDLLAQISGHFDLLVALDGPGQEIKLRGPNLIRPSARTTISPWVLSGEPVVKDSRIATATISALRRERNLGVDDLLRLYPSLTGEDVQDALAMEDELRAAA